MPPAVIAVPPMPKLRAFDLDATMNSPRETSCWARNRLPPGAVSRKPSPVAVPSEVRSKPSVDSATAQPPFSSPMIADAATRASDRNTSLKPESPVIWISGRTSTPGWFIGSAKYVMPRCLGTSGSVRASSIP
jgi:hypothetical protein